MSVHDFRREMEHYNDKEALKDKIGRQQENMIVDTQEQKLGDMWWELELMTLQEAMRHEALSSIRQVNSIRILLSNFITK